MEAAISEMKAELFRALAHPVRIRILERLADGELGVGELQQVLDLDVGVTSAHLATLRKQALVQSRREGTSVLYRVKDPLVLQLLQLTRSLLSTQLQDTEMLLRDLGGSGQTGAVRS